MLEELVSVVAVLAVLLMLALAVDNPSRTFRALVGVMAALAIIGAMASLMHQGAARPPLITITRAEASPPTPGPVMVTCARIGTAPSCSCAAR
jgi:hypothetical protein